MAPPVPSNPNFKNITGLKFGRLLVVGYSGKFASGGTKWECDCDCGNKTYVTGSSLRSGATRSCGCLNRGVSVGLLASRRSQKHPLRQVWSDIIKRTTIESATGYENYGGRGITICDRWLNSFKAFLDDMGPRPSKDHSVDRINNSLGYSPENCRWATRKQQSNNRRTNKVFTINGVSRTVAEWADATGINRNTMYYRFRSGWDPADAITLPVVPHSGKIYSPTSNASR